MRSGLRLASAAVVGAALAACGPHWVDPDTMHPVVPGRTEADCYGLTDADDYADCLLEVPGSRIVSEEEVVNGVQIDVGMLGDFVWQTGQMGGWLDVGYIVGRNRISVAGAYMSNLDEEIGQGLVWLRYVWYPLSAWPGLFFLSPNVGYATDGAVLLFGETGFEGVFREGGIGFGLSLYGGIAQPQEFQGGPEGMFGINIYMAFRTFTF